MEEYAKEIIGVFGTIVSGFILGLWRKLQKMETRIEEINDTLHEKLSDYDKDVNARIDNKEKEINKKISVLQETKVSREELRLLVETIHQDLRDIKSLLANLLGGKING